MQNKLTQKCNKNHKQSILYLGWKEEFDEDGLTTSF